MMRSTYIAGTGIGIAVIVVISGLLYSARSETTLRRGEATGSSKVSVGMFYSKDSLHVYYSSGKIVAGADPKSFRLCSPGEYNLCAIDAHTVYLDKDDSNALSARLKGVDYNSFKMLNRYYGKDKNNVFLLYDSDEGPLPHSIAGADAQSFTVLQSLPPWYAKDDRRVYAQGFVITPPVDATTVSPLGGRYVKDSKRVYLIPAPHWRLTTASMRDNILVIPNADPKTFVLLGTSVGNLTYAMDANHVYYGAMPLAEADVSSFKLVDARPRYDAQDRYRKFLAGKIVQ